MASPAAVLLPPSPVLESMSLGGEGVVEIQGRALRVDIKDCVNQ